MLVDIHEIPEDAPVYPIAIAAELAGMHPQTLRQYDRLGLVVPARTAGRVRRYSPADIAKLRDIGALTRAGVGLEGIAHVVRLRDEVAHAQRRVRELEAQVRELRAQARMERLFAAGFDEIVAVTPGQRRRYEIVVWQPAASHPDTDATVGHDVGRASTQTSGRTADSASDRAEQDAAAPRPRELSSAH